jgi:type I restriction enzyme S subunit
MRLPPNWARATPDDLSAPEPYSLGIGPFGSNLVVRDYRAHGVPLVFVRDIRLERFGGPATKCVTPAKAKELLPHHVRAGDLLITKMGDPPGDTAVYPERCPDGIITADCIRLRPNLEVTSAEYLKYLLRAPAIKDVVLEEVRGVAQQKLSLKRFRKIPFPLAPVNEQRRIVAKIDALTAKSRRAKEALDAIPPLLDKLRQSILAAAFRGDLTADWRAAHPDVVPASQLLERIRAERRRRWEEAELDKMNAKGKPPTDDRWKAKYQEPEPVDESGLPELPEGWCWIRLGELGSNPLETVQTGPFGAQLHTSEFVEDGVPVVAVGNLTGFGFTTRGLYFVTPAKAAALSRYDVQAKDLLFARSGATLGKVCVAPDHAQDWRMTGHILRARLNRTAIMPELAVYALHGAPAVVRQVQSGVRGMTRPGYNTGLLEQIVLPIPPLSEQQALAATIAKCLSQVEALSQLREELLHDTSRLDSSVLAKAFRGELVPQDPNDEPASVLLERIRTESGVQPKQTGRRRKAKTA